MDRRIAASSHVPSVGVERVEPLLDTTAHRETLAQTLAMLRDRAA